MMMIPSFGRHQETSLAPIHANEIAARRPHETVTFSTQDDDLGSRCMPVRFSISAAFDLHDMAHHRIAGGINAQPAEADAFVRMVVQRNRVDIGNKVDRGIFKLPRFQLTAEIAAFPSVAFSEFERITENKLRALVDIKNQRRVVHCHKPHRFVSRSVEMLMPSVEWRREKRTRM